MRWRIAGLGLLTLLLAILATVVLTRGAGAPVARRPVPARGGDDPKLIGTEATLATGEKEIPKEHVYAVEFEAELSGTLEKVEAHTGTTANTGVTSVKMAIARARTLEETAVEYPGPLIAAEGTYTGTPSTSTTISATVSATVVKGEKYWLVFMPLGTGGLHVKYETGGAATSANRMLEQVSGAAAHTTIAAEYEPFGTGEGIGGTAEDDRIFEAKGMGTLAAVSAGQLVMP